MGVKIFTPQRNWKQKLVGDILFRGRREVLSCHLSKLKTILSHFGVGSYAKLSFEIKIVRIVLSVA